MKSKIIFFTIILMSLMACKTVKTPLVNTVNVVEAQSGNNYKMSYVLPKTAINIKVKVHKTTYKKGPYQQYAKSFLKLNDVIQQDREVWKIVGVELSSYPIPDTSKVYIFETEDMQDVVDFSLSKNGFLKSIFPENYEVGNLRKPRKFRNQKFNKKRGFRKKRNAGKYALNQTISFDNVPLPPKVVEKSSVREQAAELSKKILSLREDRAAILIGDGYTENMPDGEALKIMIKELDFIQLQYLSMFAGKKVEKDLEYNFTYVPDNDRQFSKAILFRFSEDNGIVGNADMSGKPIMLEVKAYNKLANYKKFKYSNMFLLKSAKKMDKGLHYNLAENAIIRLLDGDKCLASSQKMIAQMGIVDKLPSEYLNGFYTIEFYPNLGTLKSIRKKKQITKEN